MTTAVILWSPDSGVLSIALTNGLDGFTLIAGRHGVTSASAAECGGADGVQAMWLRTTSEVERLMGADPDVRSSPRLPM
jgi:hypothetical protein